MFNKQDKKRNYLQGIALQVTQSSLERWKWCGRIKLYRKNGKELELIDHIAATHIGCEYGEYDS